MIDFEKNTNPSSDELSDVTNGKYEWITRIIVFYLLVFVSDEANVVGVLCVHSLKVQHAKHVDVSFVFTGHWSNGFYNNQIPEAIKRGTVQNRHLNRVIYDVGFKTWACV